MIVDDNRTNQLVLSKMLAPTEAELTICGNGQEAVDSYKNAQFDLIFMDVSMPVMDGHSATRVIREIEETCGAYRCPIVALTGNAQKVDMAACLTSGMDAFLPKPVRKRQITEILSDHLTPPELLKRSG